MMSLVKNIEDETQFTSELSNMKLKDGNDKLFVIDFYADWCGPCKMIAPFLTDLSVKYTNVTFLKVNVDKLPGLATNYNVSAMPTFLFIKNNTKIDVLQGANSKVLEAKILLHGGPLILKEGDVCVKGQTDLIAFLSKSQCECLNESNEHTLLHALEKGSEYLESDTDEQLIIYLVFNQMVKIHSLCIDAPEDCGPKNIKLFVNQTAPPDFESCTSATGTQEIALKPDDLKENQVTGLKFVKFQNVTSLTIFIQNNLASKDVTRINYLALYGKPVATTNMNEFKKTTGKKGETSS